MGDLVRLNFFDPRNWNPNLFIPDFHFQSVAHIPPELLDELGIQGILLDVDNTLGGYHCLEVHPSIDPYLKRLCEGRKVALLSNTNEKRRATLADHFGIEVVPTAYKKPDREAFLDALKCLGTSGRQTVMIGDRRYTDISGARKTNIVSILVDPFDLHSEPLHLRFGRALESSVLRGYSACYTRLPGIRLPF